MPKIPDYRSRVPYPIPRDVGAPHAGVIVAPELANAEGVKDFTGSIAKGMKGMGNTGANILTFVSRATDANSLSKGMADAAVQLGALRDKYIQSPDFNLNPEATIARFNADVQAIGAKIGQGIGNTQARQLFDQHFAKTAAAHSVEFGHDSVKAKIRLLQRESLEQIENFKNQAAIAPSDLIFKQHIGSLKTALAGAVASGVWGADQAERLRESAESGALLARANLGLINNPAQVAAEISERKPGSIWAGLPATYVPHLLTSAESRMKQLNDDARRTATTDGYNYVRDRFQIGRGGDVAMAIDWLSDPENARKAGLTEIGQVSTVQNLLYAQNQHQNAIQEQRQKAQVEAFNQKALKAFLDGSLDVPAVSNADVPYSVKQDWINILGKRAEGQTKDEDQRAYNAVMVGIHSEPGSPGHIESISQVLPHVASGRISGQKLSEINAAIATANDPTRSPFIAQAKESFMARYADIPQAKSMFPRFLEVLNRHIRAEGLKGEAITKRALDLLTAQEEGWFSRLMNWANDTPDSLTWQEQYEEILESQKQEPRSPQSPTQPALDPRVSERIESLRQGGMPEDVIAGHLRDKGFDPGAYGVKE